MYATLLPSPFGRSVLRHDSSHASCSFKTISPAHFNLCSHAYRGNHADCSYAAARSRDDRRTTYLPSTAGSTAGSTKDDTKAVSVSNSLRSVAHSSSLARAKQLAAALKATPAEIISAASRNGAAGQKAGAASEASSDAGAAPDLDAASNHARPGGTTGSRKQQQQQLGGAPPRHGSGVGSVGIKAAIRAREAAKAGSDATWALRGDTEAAFPTKHPLKRRRVERSDKKVDAQMYSQVAASRNRLAAQLSDANRYIAHLEAELASRSADVSAAAESMSQFATQLQPLVRSAGLAAGDASARSAPSAPASYAMAQQLARLQQQSVESARRLDCGKLQEVSLGWVGVATEVRLMGSFDGWSRGVALSSRGDASDSVFHHFEGVLKARKGEYLVKFLVDGEWRLAPDWPTRDDATGSTNNVLRVE